VFSTAVLGAQVSTYLKYNFLSSMIVFSSLVKFCGLGYGITYKQAKLIFLTLCELIGASRSVFHWNFVEVIRTLVPDYNTRIYITNRSASAIAYVSSFLKYNSFVLQKIDGMVVLLTQEINSDHLLYGVSITFNVNLNVIFALHDILRKLIN
jgi:hypothetical protein